MRNGQLVMSNDQFIMKNYQYPDQSEWFRLCQRPEFDWTTLESNVSEIMSAVKTDGDESLKRFSERFDGVVPSQMVVDLDNKKFSMDDELANAILLAKSNIENFHSSQQSNVEVIETSPGVKCWRKNAPIQSVGLYIPGGSAPLFSTLLMLAIPAQIAGCSNIVLCTPPDKDGNLNEVIGWTAQQLELKRIYLVGGAQAIAAMTYGTASIPKVDKLFGPGNQYVTAAKQLAQREGVAIDMPAGPSEVLVIADDSANASFVAADLLSQAEHGADSQVILVSDSESLIGRVDEEIRKQLAVLPRKAVAEKALENSSAILVENLDTAMQFSNVYAPEHLIIATSNYTDLAQQVKNAGSVFLGNWSCESAGDYASGTNHTLPTNGYARSYSGVSLDSFVKKITFQELSEKGIQNLGPSIEKMAEAEQLDAHKNAVSLRLNYLNNV